MARLTRLCPLLYFKYILIKSITKGCITMQIRTKVYLKWTAGLLTSLIVLSLILILLLPTLSKWYATSWLEERGSTISFKDLSINLFDGQFHIKGFTSIGPEKHKINLGDVLLQVHLRDLINNTVTIEKFEFSDFYVDIFQQNGKPIKIGGIQFANAETITTPLETKIVKKEGEKTTPWKITVNNIKFKKFETCLKLNNEDNNPLYNNCLSLGQFNWNGYTSYIIDSNENTNKIDANLSFTLNNIQLNDTTDKSEVINIGALHVKNIKIHDLADIKIDFVKIENYAVLQRADIKSKDTTHIADIKHVTLSKLNIKKLNEVSISDVNIDSLQTYLFRQENGKFEPSEKITQLLLPETQIKKIASSDNSQKEAESTSIIKIKKLSIAGNSKITAKDDGIKPHYAGTVANIKMKLTDIDSSKPAQESPLKFSFVIGRQGSFDFTGNVKIFAKKPTLTLKGKIRAINAADFSAYLNTTIQHRIKSGQIDSDIDLKIDQGKLNSNLNLTLHKLYIEQLSEEESKLYKEKLGVPLSVALNLLRERDDSIHLSLPITGDVKNPDFSLNKIIQKVMTDQITSTVISYYTPFGLVTLLNAAFNLATALSFDPLYFEMSNVELTNKHKSQLESLITMLTERPKIKLVVCGHSTLEDRFKLFPIDEKLKKQIDNTELNDSGEAISIENLLPNLKKDELSKLNTLAIQRGENVRDYLTLNKSIDSTRIIMCNPRYENDTEKPHVSVSL